MTEENQLTLFNLESWSRDGTRLPFTDADKKYLSVRAYEENWRLDQLKMLRKLEGIADDVQR